MAEALGTALSIVGAVGVLGQIFDGCIKAYSLFTSASNVGRDSERLVCKIRIEEMRLLVWGREWGVMEGKLEAHLQAESNAGNERMRALATQILQELYRTITDLGRLKEKYGITEEPLSPGEEKKIAQKIERTGMASRIRNELTLRAKWVIADKDKFTVLLKDLKDFNDGLEQLFPPSRLATIHRTWQNQLLQKASQDLSQLKLLESASIDTYPRLNASASLKQLRINLDLKPQASFKPTYALKIARPSLSILDNDPRRSTATYQNSSGTSHQDVVVEWIPYDKEDIDGRVHHIRRIDDLARMIHSASSRHPDLHTLNCLGYTDDSAMSRYGLIYSAPFPTSSNLASLISSKDFRTPDLGDRFRLAHTLAIALWSLHSLDWLHKSVCSANILFFPSAPSAATKAATLSAATVAPITSPFLIGFDASRPDQAAEFSVAARNGSNSSSEILHRHPDSLDPFRRKTYCKSYDVYSLGLVLLEIGLWKPLQNYWKPNYSAEKFRDKVVWPVLVPGLGSKTGGLYRSVVERCLGARADARVEEVGLLMEWVVGSLESLRV